MDIQKIFSSSHLLHVYEKYDANSLNFQLKIVAS